MPKNESIKEIKNLARFKDHEWDKAYTKLLEEVRYVIEDLNNASSSRNIDDVKKSIEGAVDVLTKAIE